MREIERLTEVARDMVEELTRECIDAEDGAKVVRSILQALREPSEGITDAMFAVEDDGSNVMAQLWQAAIDHLLSEAP